MKTPQNPSPADFAQRFQHPEFDDASRCFEEMLGEIIMEICFDCHWSMKTGLSSNLTKAQQIAAKDALGNRDLDVRPSNNGSNPIVECPVCLGGVAGARFAAHLEKCLNGGLRVSSKRSRSAVSTYNVDKIGNSSEAKDNNPPKKTPKRKLIYGSLVVRIKFKNGMPVPGTRRETVSFSTFHFRQLAREAREKEANEREAKHMIENNLDSIDTDATSEQMNSSHT